MNAMESGPRERPILFRPEMVRAVLSGRKTQTRRPVLPQPVPAASAGPGDSTLILGVLARVREWRLAGGGAIRVPEKWECPYGVAGDRLWVRETWATAACYDHVRPSGLTAHSSPYYYRADGAGYPDGMGRWRPSIHMPRVACRLELMVVATRLERLHELSRSDAGLEGIPFSVFDAAWDEVYAPRGLPWESDPMVWVVTFAVDDARIAGMAGKRRPLREDRAGRS